ncbi:MAG: hypothetical protein H6737_30075 [Alphaproteobacteria bacterium]|nr:hypothetical protein [Alphaproteobacteria bacterium]
MTAWSSKAGAGPELGALAIPLMLSLTLGLAPLTPEPHIVGKIRWVAGGAVGMGAMDWFDLVMHGAPLVWFAVTLVRVVLARFGSAPQPRQKGSAS